MLLLLLSAAAAAAAAPRPAELKTFRDWIVGCDNGRACQAVALMPEDDFEAATITVTRAAGGSAPPEIWISAGDKKPAALLVDGRRFPIAAHNGDGDPYRPADPGALLEALRDARSAALVDSAGTRLAPLSAAGASAAFLYMDEKQGRIGTVTALARRGPAPASAVPPPPALPVIVSAPASARPARKPTPAQIRKARGDSVCEDPSQEQAPQSFRLDSRYTLVLVPVFCGSGAYNFLYAALLLDDSGRATDAPFEQPAGTTADPGEMIYNADWDMKARRLGTYFKGRGLGDCGTTQVYAWDGQRFRLAEQAEMGECRGSVDYITTWRAMVR